MDDITPLHKMDLPASRQVSPAEQPKEPMHWASQEITTPKLIGIFIGLIIAGAISGLVLSKTQAFLRARSLSSPNTKKEAPKEVAGIKDKKTFSDATTGILKDGGFDGEGSHHLERPGGKSQNVYITSSTVDLSAYVDHKVTVHGQTFAAEKAGWLMDVGLVEVLD